MKKLFTLALGLCVGSAFGQSQKQVMLHVVHNIGQNPCTTAEVGQNDQGDDFKLTRVQYYMHDLQLVHDNGTNTPTNAVALVNGFNDTWVDLGLVNVDSLEALRFGIGVNGSYNHLDPSSYPSTSPLAPKNPSMHWGWTAGYRFIALEGVTGPNFNTTFQFHGLGDRNYWMQTISTQGQHITDTLEITIYADYEQVLKGIGVASGPIIHGETGLAASVLENMNTVVFTSEEGNTALGLNEVGFAQPRVFPNPSNGVFNFELTQACHVSIYDLTGALVVEKDWTAGSHMLTLNQSGLYFASFTSGESSYTERIIVQ